MSHIFCSSIPAVAWERVDGMDNFCCGNTDVWRIPVSACARLNYLYNDVLEPYEITTSQNFYREEDKNRFVAGRIALKLLLGKYTGQMPGEIRVLKSGRGKPYINYFTNKRVHFNMAHSGDWILIAISGMELGIDIEKIDPGFHPGDVIDRYFSPQEKICIEQSIDPVKLFFTLWTRKEAFSKMISSGLDSATLAINFCDGERELPHYNNITASNGYISSFMAADGYIGSLSAL